MGSTRSRMPSGAKQGFALVLALTIMAFIVLLLVSMTLLVRVETEASSATLARLQAREAARLALMMALGDLQKHAGPDQRVTARAEITGVTNNNRYWTGVWDTTNPSAEPVWLVSGDAPDPATELDGSMQLVGSGTVGANGGDIVNAPAIELSATPSMPATRIAWWVSDEGVKASAATLPLKFRETPSYQSPASLDSLELIISSSHGLEEIFTSYDRFDADDEEETRVLPRIDSIEQLMSIGDFADESNTDFSGEAPFHAITPISFGVLASTISSPDGGLMRDLSLFPELLGSGVGAYLALGEEHANSQNPDPEDPNALRLFTEIKGLDDIGTLTDGQIYVPIAPILSNLMLAFTIYHPSSTSSENLHLRMRCFFELWNPYTHSLNLTDEGGNPIEFDLELTGLPTVEVSNGTDSTSVEMQSVVGSEPTNTGSPMIIQLVPDSSRDWLPGQALNWTGVDADETAGNSPYVSNNVSNKRWNLNSNTLGGSNGLPTEFTLTRGGNITISSSNDIQLGLALYSRNTATGERSKILELNDIRYEPFTTISRSHTQKSMNFGFHIQLREPQSSINDPEYFRGLWLYDHDPRSLFQEFNADWFDNNDHEFQTGSRYAPVIDGKTPIAPPDPVRLNENPDSTIDADSFGRLLDRSTGSGNFLDKLWQDAPIFELPRERVLSLASLQHIYIHNERPYQIGNSWATEGQNNELEWFDRYYFTGLSRDDSPEEYLDEAGLPNPILVGYNFEEPDNWISEWQSKDPDNEDAARTVAEHFLVSNRFNINSTSLASWRAVLGSLRLNDYKYLDYPEDDTSDLSTLSVASAAREGTFTRFSHSLKETYEAPETPATVNNFSNVEPVAPSAFYRHGARRLDSNQLEELASEIVRLLQAQGRPFTSMKSFLSVLPGEEQSLIEKAIEDVLAPDGRQEWYHKWETQGTPKNESGETPIDIDHFSPGFLTQADIMTAIGPMLAPRSDTFRIRARGEILSQPGELEAAATLEAIIQRTPEPLDRTIDPIEPTNRRFRVIGIRWLSDSDL